MSEVDNEIMRAEGLTGRGVIDRFLMIDRFY